MARDVPSDNAERQLFVRSFFSTNPPVRVTQEFASKMQYFNAYAGNILFERETPPDTIFFVLEGEVRLEAPGQEPWGFEKHSMIGILDAILSRPHARTLVAVTDIRGLVIKTGDYFDIMEENFTFNKDVTQLAYRGLHTTALQLAPYGVFASLKEQSTTGFVPCIRRKQGLNAIERLMVLHNARVFHDPPVEALSNLANLSKEQRWNPKDIIFRQKDPASSLHIVADGSVRVSSPDPKVVATFGPGGLLGGHSAVGFEERLYDAEVLTPTVTLCIEKEDLYDVMEDHFGMIRSFGAFIAIERERVMEAIANNSKETAALKEAI